MVALPELNAIVMHAGDSPHAVGFGLEVRMTQQTANKEGGIIRPNIQEDETVSCVASPSLKKSPS